MNVTENLKSYLKDKLTLDDLLPTKLPVYLNSVAYLFGVFSLCSLFILIITGLTMAIFGPLWYHVSGTGKLFNSFHYWAVQLLFLFMLLHLATKYFLGAFRDGRWKTWMVGALILGASIFTAFTGYLSAANWSAQWHAVEAKDAMNAMGIGGFFFTTNYTQVLSLHVAFFPAAVGLLVVIHILFIRHEGPVKPYPLRGGKTK